MADYTSATDVKTWGDITGSTFDLLLDTCVTAASRQIDQHCNRSFSTTAVSASARLYTAVWDSGRKRYVVEIDDLSSVTDLAVTIDTAGDGTFSTTVTVADLTKYPLNASAFGRPWTHLVLPQDATVVTTEGAVKVTARWGWTAVPEVVEQAALIQAFRLFMRRSSWAGISGSPEMMGETRLLAKLDADVKVLLQPVVRHWGARNTASDNNRTSVVWWS